MLGSLQCPSSIHTRGIVHSPAGEAFEVQGSLLRFSDSTDGTTCETVTEELSTDYLGPASTLLPGTFSRLGVAGTKALGDALLPDLNSEEMRLLEAVANLDESQFQMLRALTRLTPEGWDALASHLETEGGAQIADEGSVGPPGKSSDNTKAEKAISIGDVHGILVAQDVQLDGQDNGNYKTPLSLIYNLLVGRNVALAGKEPHNFKIALSEIDNDLELLRGIPGREGEEATNVKNLLARMDQSLGLLHDIPVRPAAASLGPTIGAHDNATESSGLAVDPIRKDMHRTNVREMLTRMDTDLGNLLTSRLDSEVISGLETLVSGLESNKAQITQLTKIFPDLVRDTLKTMDFDPDKGSLVLAFYSSLRAGFGRFKSSDCSESEKDGPCLANFKTDLKMLFGNLQGLQGLFPQFQGLFPQFINEGDDLKPFEDIIDIAPPFPLFVMANGLHQIAPPWRDTTSHLGEIQKELVPILDEVPRDFLFEGFQAKVGMKANFSPLRACTIFTSGGRTLRSRRASLSRITTFLTATKILFAVIKEFNCKYDQNGNATVVAHGLGGTLGPSLCRMVAGGGKVVVEGLGEAVGRLTAIYDRCEMLEFEALDEEGLLASCAPLVSLMLPRRVEGEGAQIAVGGHLDSLIELVELRSWQVTRARGPGAAAFDLSHLILLAKTTRKTGTMA